MSPAATGTARGEDSPPLPPFLFVIICFAALLGCTRPFRIDKQLEEAAQSNRKGDFLAARIRLEKLKNANLLPKDKFATQELLAETACLQGKYAEAISLLDPPPLTSSVDSTSVKAMMIRGYALGRLGTFTDAHRELDKAKNFAEGLNLSLLLGELANRRGIILGEERRYKEAEEEFRHALSVARNEQDPYLEFQALGNLGVLFGRELHRFDEALAFSEEASIIAKRFGNQSRYAMYRGNVGWCQFELGDWEMALRTFSESLTQSARVGDLNSELNQLNNIGRIYQAMSDYGASERYYQRSLTLAKTLHLSTETASALHNLAQIAYLRSDFDRASSYAQEAIQIRRANKNHAAELHTLLTFAQIEHARSQLSSAERHLREIVNDPEGDLNFRAFCQEELASIQVDQHETTEARKEFTKALVAIDSARNQIVQSEYKLSYFANSARFYNAYIDFLIKQNSPLEALRIAELGRAQTLVEGFPEIDQLRPALKRPEKIAASNGSVLLSYWLAPEASYLWAVTPQKTQFVKLPPAKEIQELVTQHQKAVLGLRDPLEDSNAPGRKLYDMLVAPAAKWIPKDAKIIVIPDATLAPLNFETLIASDPKPHYWIEDVTLATASSMLLLAGNSNHTVKDRGADPLVRAGSPEPASRRGRRLQAWAPAPLSSDLLVLGDPVLKGSDFPPLPHAAEELREIQVRFPQRVSYSGAEAKPSVYRASNPDQYSYIHFATHGISSRQSPLDSAVILSREGDLNKLYAREIVQIPIHARLVTISACHASGSRSYQGEGLVGLAWAFLRAGAQNVIASLWEVDDSVSPLVMKGLYSDLAQGKDPASALRDAKLSLLRSDTVYRKPLYWGTFQLYKGRAGRIAN